MGPGSDGAAAQLVVGAAVAGEPARQFAVRVGAAGGVDLGDILRVLGEFDDQPVGGGDVDRLAIAVIGLAVLLAGPLEPLFQLGIGFGLGLEGDVLVAADLGRLLGLGQLVHLRVGELEEGERAAVGHGEEGVAELDLTL